MNSTLTKSLSAQLSADDPGLSIAVVERDTGLGKDTLRVWEKRYGFPRPLRDSSGDRRYPAVQVRQLQLIRRLIDAGLRPGKVVGLEASALQKLWAELDTTDSSNLSTTKKNPDQLDTQISAFLDTIGTHSPQELKHALNRAQVRMGLANFVTDMIAPLNTAVGEAWAQGRFEVFEEHLYTEVVTSVLRHAITSLGPLPVSSGPKVLLTTLPQELHGLGLLMVEALLALEGCTCVSLGTQTPMGDVVRAAQAHRVDVVALSFSNVHKGPVVRASLRELRAQLPAATALWVGGSCTALYQKTLEGITASQELSNLQHLVDHWRRTH